MKNHHTTFTSIIYIILVIIVFVETSATKKPYSSLLERITAEETVTIEEFREAIKSLDLDTDQKGEDKSELRQNFAKVINEYAKALFYGQFNGGKPEIQKAYYFFKLASEYGSSETLYYLSFYSFYNLDGRFLYKNNYKNLESSDSHGYMKYYIDKMNVTNLISNSFVSSLQGYTVSTSILGNLYYHGRGTERKCPSSALYFKQLAEMLFVKDELKDYKSPELLERRKLDELYFHHEEDIESTQVVEDALEYIKRNANLKMPQYLAEMGHIYYFGLKGEKRDLKQAFNYYFQAANAGDPYSKMFVGKMLIEGIGVQKDVKYGMQFLTAAEFKNEPEALNILGKLYYYGDGVEKDEQKAIGYFKTAADKNITDAMYNYAGILLKSTDPISRTKGLQLIDAAAKSGHALAMLHLGLQYLEGTDIFYNCELGAGFLKSVTQRGPWNRKLRNGYVTYKKKNHKLAALYYMEAALIGYDFANSNAGLIIDRYQVFDEHDLDIQKMQKEVIYDPIWKQLDSTSHYKPPSDMDELLNGDILEILTTLKYDQNKKTEILKSLTKPLKNLGESFNQHVTFELLRTGAEEDDELSLLKLGDIYQEGKIVPQNFTQAYEYYSSIFRPRIYSFIINTEIAAMAMYNMAYMTHNGLGKKKNLTEAIIQYETSIKLNFKSTNYMVHINKKLAEWEKFYFDKYSNSTGEVQEEEDSTMSVKEIIKHQMTYFEEKYSKPLFMGFFILAAFVLFLVKLRLENYMDIYLKDQRRPKTD